MTDEDDAAEMNDPETVDDAPKTNDISETGDDVPETVDEAPKTVEDPKSPDDEITLDEFHDAIEKIGRPVLTADAVARTLDCSHETADRALTELAELSDVERLDVSNDPVVWYPTDWAAVADRERVVLFPERREILVDQPEQFTRAQLSQFAHLVDTSGSGGYMYELREEDIWQAPHDSLADLVATIRTVVSERSPHLEEWIERQWKRARKFTLTTHPDGYTVLEATSDDLMGNVARQKLDDDQLRAPISDSASWVAEGTEADIKRTLYEAGYPVRDERELDEGEELDVDLELDLREYQRHWVEQFEETGSGVLVGPPGSGKTVAGMGALASVGGETLILVPSRELAGQWRTELLANTTLTADQIGEYHGGTKQVRPVTIATYQTAGMDRHRKLFDQRRWGLILYDEVHHIPATVYRRSADIQSKHRLGLSASAVREDDKEKEIFTLVGPPIGTDWSALFDAGFVQEPTVEIRHVPWGSEMQRNEYASAEGHERRQVAAMNPAKRDEIERLMADHEDAKTLIFVEYLDQGDAYAEALDVPFVSGEMRHARRERLFEQFRRGERDTLVVSRVGDEGIDLPDAELAIVASGLGGSRRQGAQRAGRTMRPAGNALMYVLATRGTAEEDFAQRQMRHLSAKGIRVRETDSPTID